MGVRSSRNGRWIISARVNDSEIWVPPNMNYNRFPVIHITVEHMRDQITHAIALHEHQINDEVAQAVKQAVDNFDFVGEIRRVANEAIQRAVRDCVEGYFKYGNGYKAIKQVVQETIDRMNNLDEHP